MSKEAEPISEVEKAAKEAAIYEQGIIRLPIEYKENPTPSEQYEDRLKRSTAACEAMFIEGAKWLLGHAAEFVQMTGGAYDVQAYHVLDILELRFKPIEKDIENEKEEKPSRRNIKEHKSLNVAS